MRHFSVMGSHFFPQKRSFSLNIGHKRRMLQNRGKVPTGSAIFVRFQAGQKRRSHRTSLLSATA